jgi:hypothetical protein
VPCEPARAPYRPRGVVGVDGVLGGLRVSDRARPFVERQSCRDRSDSPCGKNHGGELGFADLRGLRDFARIAATDAAPRRHEGGGKDQARRNRGMAFASAAAARA